MDWANLLEAAGGLLCGGAIATVVSSRASKVRQLAREAFERERTGAFLSLISEEVNRHWREASTRARQEWEIEQLKRKKRPG